MLFSGEPMQGPERSAFARLGFDRDARGISCDYVVDLYRALFRLPLPVVEARILSWLGQEQLFLPDELPGNAAEVARESHIDVLQLELLMGYRGTRRQAGRLGPVDFADQSCSDEQFK